MKSAGGSSSRTFARFYDKPVDTATVHFGPMPLNPVTLWLDNCISLSSYLGRNSVFRYELFVMQDFEVSGDSIVTHK